MSLEEVPLGGSTRAPPEPDPPEDAGLESGAQPPRRRRPTTKRAMGSAWCEWECTPAGIARRLRGLNALAVPFLDEVDDAEADDYALLPPPKPLRVPQLMGIAFFAVSGSAYGFEATISMGGPFLTILALILAPLLWSAPMVMVVTELSVALPHSGGYIIWVNTAFGALPSLLNGMSNMLCNVLDCALYPLLLTDYLQRVAMPALLPTYQSGLGGDHDWDWVKDSQAASCHLWPTTMHPRPKR